MGGSIIEDKDVSVIRGVSVKDPHRQISMTQDCIIGEVTIASLPCPENNLAFTKFAFLVEFARLRLPMSGKLQYVLIHDTVWRLA